MAERFWRHRCRMWIEPFRFIAHYTAAFIDYWSVARQGRNGAGGMVPVRLPVNILVGPQDLVLTAEVPGVEPDGMTITVQRSQVIVSGRFRGRPRGLDFASEHLRERPFGRFERTISLPFAADPAKVVAVSRHGTLVITVPRPVSQYPKRIRVTS